MKKENVMIVSKSADNFNVLHFLDVYIENTKGFIAGGCFKNIFNKERIKDVDLFFENEADFTISKMYFDRNFSLYSKYYENDNVVAYKDIIADLTIELCKKTYAVPKDMLEMFDFTIAKFAYYDVKTSIPSGQEKIHTKHVLCDDQYFEHLFTKRLVCDDKIMFPVSTFERMIRYAGYGYMPCRETKLKILNSIIGFDGEITLSKSLYDGID